MKSTTIKLIFVAIILITLTNCSNTPVAEETKTVESLFTNVDSLAIKAIIDSSKVDTLK